jgi:hypothetical protein
MSILQLKPEAEAAGGLESRPQHQERKLAPRRKGDIQITARKRLSEEVADTIVRG